MCEQYAKAFEEGDAEDSNDEEANCRKVVGVGKGKKKLKVAGASETKPDAPSHGKYLPYLYNEKRLAFIVRNPERKPRRFGWLPLSAIICWLPFLSVSSSAEGLCRRAPRAIPSLRKLRLRLAELIICLPL